ncbi:unnamed protein product [Caenorhabditis auriculariae]|uniref:Uncharacterized protein n=1 Tax=Caenorhabditis auriculariae TaxID=2777116 RepID=A0A8S1GUQ6_9PELO|nr:unnamed protein product [Caenorhabditis auriculariae]
MSDSPWSADSDLERTETGLIHQEAFYALRREIAPRSCNHVAYNDCDGKRGAATFDMNASTVLAMQRG